MQRVARPVHAWLACLAAWWRGLACWLPRLRRHLGKYLNSILLLLSISFFHLNSRTTTPSHPLLQEARKFARPLGLECTAVYGGSGVANQITELKRGTEVG